MAYWRVAADDAVEFASTMADAIGAGVEIGSTAAIRASALLPTAAKEQTSPEVGVGPRPCENPLFAVIRAIRFPDDLRGIG